jgi:hypothetical protein
MLWYYAKGKLRESLQFEGDQAIELKWRDDSDDGVAAPSLEASS